MIGTQRSGSNLLRVMLHQLYITAPHPPHILERFMPIVAMYGDLHLEQNFKRLAEDVCQLILTNPVTWGDLALDTEKVISLCQSKELVEIMRVVYDLKCQAEGNTIWMNKSMANVHYIDELEKFLKPLYLYLYRDGRDVALSFKKAVVGEKHIYHLAKQWQIEQELSYALKSRIDSDRIVIIKYEELIASPDQQLEKICRFLDIPFDQAALEYYNSQESKETAHSGKMWENVQKPVIATNFNKYRKELSEEEIRIFERVAGTTLLKLGYTLDFPEMLDRPAFSTEEIAQFNEENKKAKLEILQHQTEQDQEKREKQNELLKSLKKQFLLFEKQNTFIH